MSTATRKNDVVLVGGSRRFVKVREVESSLLRAYSQALAGLHRMNEGRANSRDRVAALAIEGLEPLVRKYLGSDALVVSDGSIGQLFYVSGDDVVVQAYMNN